MGKFTAIPKDTFDALQLDAGVLLNTFNPASIAAPQDGDIICATTGGINATCGQHQRAETSGQLGVQNVLHGSWHVP